MSELTLFKAGNVALPDYLREGDDFTKQMAGSSGGKAISIEGGVWRMLVGGEEVAKNEDRSMNFVVVNGNPKVSRVFYNTTYVKGQSAPPACYSEDGETPSANARSPQSSKCATCKQNIAGSGQGESRACRYLQRIAVVLEGDIGGNVYRLQLPAKSIFGKPEGNKMPFQAYARFLAGHGAPMSGVVTEVRFDTSEAVPVLKFSAVRPLTRDEFLIAKEQGQSVDALDALEVKFADKKPAGASAGGAASVPALPESFSKATPAYAEEEQEPAPETQPVKRASKKAEPAAPTGSKSIDALMNEWGTDDE